ncbi:MAG: major capsid protein [Sphingomonadales bacterium]|nr:major capsid protein [Sphingomonadales bacterium]
MDFYNTTAMLTVINSLFVPGNFLLRLFFPGMATSATEEIFMDRIDDDFELVPFVSPLVEGKVQEDVGYHAETIKPAYIKPKNTIRPDQMLRRAPGERIGGDLSPEQRLARKIAELLVRHRTRYDRRLEVMASELVRTGAMTISGPQYPTVVVNFGRAAALSKTLSGAARWGETGVSPVDDVEGWAEDVAEEVGAAPNVVVMDKLAWGYFSADTKLEKKLDIRRGGVSSIELGFQPGAPGSPIFKGFLGDVQIYVYNDKYKDDAGATQKLIPENTVIVGAPGAVDGIKAHGAILDDQSLMAQQFFPKSWVKDDPGIRYLMTQSAPILVPKRINGTLRATVR